MDRVTEEVRPTDDVDILLEIVTYPELEKVEEQLRKMGFKHDMYARHALRYNIENTVVDLMPTGNVTGVTNIWYANGYKNSVDYEIDDLITVRIFRAVYCIASKLEAFKSSTRKYNNDGRQSRDFEDIVFILENRRNIWDEFEKTDHTLKSYLKDEFKRLLAIPYFEEWLDAHAGFGSPPASYMIFQKLKDFIK